MRKNFWPLTAVIVAGEAVFLLPFLIPRLLRPMMITHWDLSNQQIGGAFAAYGLSAMISYFFGGPLADRFAPNVLIAGALALTSLGGFLLAFFHSPLAFILTYAFFGVSTILLLWGAMIRYAHVTGGEEGRATSMGLLDAGRGLLAAVVSTLIITGLQRLTGDAEGEALRLSYLFVAGLTLLLAPVVWWALRRVDPIASKAPQWKVSEALLLLRRGELWLLGGLILCAYCGYKSVDNFATYLVDVAGLERGRASELTSYLLWLRPIAALLAGVAADRWMRSSARTRFSLLSGQLALAAVALLGLGLSTTSRLPAVLAFLVTAASAAYALRAIYFAVLGELRVPPQLVGTAVGLVSVVGFLPDFFYGALTGTLIDRAPGAAGHGHALIVTGGLLALGALCAQLLAWRTRRLD